MKKLNKLRLSVLGALMIVLPVITQANPSDEETKLRQTIEKFNQAFMQADVSTLDSLLTEQYLHTNSGNRAFAKNSWLKWIKSRQAAVEAGKLIYTSYQTQDLDIVLYPDAAVVTGRNIAKGRNDDKPFEVDIRFSHLWVKQAGQWRRASFHDAPAK